MSVPRSLSSLAIIMIITLAAVFFLFSSCLSSKQGEDKDRNAYALEPGAEQEKPSAEKKDKEKEEKPKEKSEAEKREDTYAEIEEQMGKGETEKALHTFESQEGTPESPEDLLLYGLLLLANGDYEKAYDVMVKAAETAPEDTEILYNLSLIEGARGNLKKQQELLEKIIRLKPEHVEAQTALGEIYLRKKKKGAARKAFLDALKKNDAYTPARVGYARTLMEEGKYEKAKEELDRVIEAEPDNPMAYIDRSRAKLALSDREGAVEDLTRAIELEPDYFWNYLDRGRIYVKTGNRRAALEDFTKAIELDDSIFFPFAYRAGIYEELGLFKEAVADYKRVVALRDDYFFAHLSLGKLLYMMEKWEESAYYFRKSYAYDEEMPSYALLAALALKRGGKSDEAKLYLQEKMPAIDRESLYYHLFRLYTEKGYDSYFMFELEKEKEEAVKAKGLFFLASYYLLQGRQNLAKTYFLEIEETLPPEEVEASIVEWELKLNLGE